MTVAVYFGSPHVSLRTALGSFSDYSLEAATIGLGILLGWALDEWPVALLLIVGITLVLHRSVLVRQLREQARSDRKTGLLNAEAWADAARAELARGEQLKHSSGLLVLDLDFFKKVNDTHGHLAGDDVLRATAATLQAEVRAGDLVGRFGGEEFVVLLPNIGQAEAVAIAERIRRRVGATAVPLTQGGDGPADITVTVSIGVASHPKDASSLEALMQAADTALYQAKAAGRNRTLLYVAPDEGGLRAVG
ncbi:GGDEF domain-containing protein [Amycolatopsis suaedae]|uniref:GGDEF domain-containing protein n=1 Tax=Amycolatopsis suaedae TaxID=2510978 RepID=UPI001F0DC0A9|nr:GGDEF domain-containing protein [Amycolatopsis suaedae]